MLHIAQGKPSCGSRPSHRISFLSRIALRCHLISWCMFGPLAILVHLHWAGVCLWLNMLDLVAARAWEKSFCCLFKHQLVVLLNAPLSTCCLIGFSRSQPPISRIMFCPLRLCFSPGTSKWCRLGTSGRGLAPSPSVANSLANLTCFYLMQSIVKWFSHLCPSLSLDLWLCQVLSTLWLRFLVGKTASFSSIPSVC